MVSPYKYLDLNLSWKHGVTPGPELPGPRVPALHLIHKSPEKPKEVKVVDRVWALATLAALTALAAKFCKPGGTLRHENTRFVGLDTC